MVRHGWFIESSDIVWKHKHRPEERELHAALSATLAEIKRAKGVEG